MSPKAAVIGYPVNHSLSPVIHGFWRKKYNISGAYERISCSDAKEFRQTVDTLRALDYAGCNVTIPYKRDAFELADESTETARRLGVANMLTFLGEKTLADNSDVAGFRNMIHPHLKDQRIGQTALIIGAGGAAPAVALGLHELGITEVCIANRTAARAEPLKDKFEFIDRTGDWSGINDLLPDINILVNTTSLGMSGFPDLEIDLALAKPDLLVADIVYTPNVTGLLRRAQDHGLRTVGGMAMLVNQAAPGFAQWFGKTPAPTAGLYEHLNDRLDRRSRAPVKIGLTGSIGMGKSTALAVLAEAGAAVWDADAAVHRLYAEGGAAVPAIAGAFPGAIEDNAVSRAKLSQHLLEFPGDYARLEELVHPLVSADREQFIRDAEADGAGAVVLDIPLLFETGQSYEFDAVVVVTADEAVRKERVLRREKMTPDKFESIVSRQMPEQEKVLLADHVVRTDQALENTRQDLHAVYSLILENYR